MTVVTIHKAKTELSKLIARVEAGEEIEIARRDKVVAKLVPVPTEAKTKNKGIRAWNGQVKVIGDLREPMSAEELSLWEDGPVVPPR